MRLTFPQDFIWGAATASFQVEGGIEERGRCIWDDFCRWPGKVVNGDTGDVADDHYHRYRQDIALMQQLNLGAYRFSISWPRIMPDGVGELNQAGLDFYDRLVDALLEANIRPFATLYHWDLPSELQRVGGWAARDTVQRFVDYVAVVAGRLGDRVHDWITQNEPWVIAHLGNLMGVHAPGWQDLGLALQVGHHVLLSHGLAVPVLRALGAEQRVGITLNLYPVYPAGDSEQDALAARLYDGFANRWFLDPVYRASYPEDMLEVCGWAAPRIAPGDMEAIAAPTDFLGINYYSRAVLQYNAQAMLKGEAVRPAGAYTAMDWEVYPQGLTDLLVRIKADYNPKQLYITENGAAYEDILVGERVHDGARRRYLAQHFAAAQQAIRQGVPLAGYFAWSLLDNFEWALGYSKRFGIVYVDYATQQRYPKDSALYLARVAADNGLDSADVEEG